MVQLIATPDGVEGKDAIIASYAEFVHYRGACNHEQGRNVNFTFSFFGGSSIDQCLFEVSDITEDTLGEFFIALRAWKEIDKYRVIVTHSTVLGLYDFSQPPGEINVEVFDLTALQETIRQYAAEGTFGEIPAGITITLDKWQAVKELKQTCHFRWIAGHLIFWRRP
ncbi:MAG: hypothetical protein KDD67_03210 [Ignavibacteriae bacterium]|nr:hypothetical protein [Ignavibacteriota bacterium]MCB9217160.1 hypothetical protein [Ignavibacteria bacterium]